MKKSKLFLMLLVLFAFGPTAWAQGLSGSGTEADPYLITSTADWNTFASNVNRDNNYLNEFLKLTADITVSEMHVAIRKELHVDGNRMGRYKHQQSQNQSYPHFIPPFNV